MSVDASGNPLRVSITKGTTADCSQSRELTQKLKAEYLIADKGYDTNAIVDAAVSAGMKVVIPPKKNRKIQRSYDAYLYKLRHLVENTFLYLKQWRGIATRYAKNAASYMAAVHIRCLILWLKLI